MVETADCDLSFRIGRSGRPITSTGGGSTLTNPKPGTRHSNRERLAAEGVLKVTRVRSELGRRVTTLRYLAQDLAKKIEETVTVHCIRYFSRDTSDGAPQERHLLSCIIRFLT